MPTPLFVRSAARLIVLVPCAAVTWTGCQPAARPVTLSTQAACLTNPAMFCAPVIGSSDMEATYDRRGGNADWWDVPPPLPGTTNLYEALHVKGPGCLTRIWMTNVPGTDWLFFFDGEDQPRLSLSEGDLFWNLPEEMPLRNTVSGGCYSYLPLPFAKSLRVAIRMPTLTPNSRPYFQFNYERYPAGTRVETWPMRMDAVASNATARVNAAWRQVATEDAAIVGRMNWQRKTIPPGQQVELWSAARGGTVTAFAIRPDFRQQNPIMRSLLLRSLTLEGTWDGATQPSVQAPLGDFFCNGLHPRPFASLAMANLDGAYLCRLPMPFRRSGRLVIRNDGPVEAALDVAVDFTPGAVGDSLYLHATFHAASGTASPFRIMQTVGRGKYVGCYLISMGMDGSWNILEGDEYFYRDGGKEFVHHGTGLEDYFNGGWYYTGLFELPLHGLLEKAAMRTAQYRFHLTDPVTFRKELRMELEVGGGPGSPANGYLSAVAYWYQDQPGPAGSVLPPVGQRFPMLDQVGYLAIMSELFELERMGLIAAAEERCAFYAGALQQMPEHWLYELRRLAYREMLAGHAAVRPALAALAGNTNLPSEVVQQARLLLWRGEQPGRAIFGAHGYADYRLLVDGKLLGQGGDPAVWQGFAVELTPGEHLLQAEVVAKPQNAFFSAGFSAFFTNVVSDASWDFSRTKPEGWPEREGERQTWQPFEGEPGILPTMAWWRFAANGIPCVQAWHQAGGPCGDWGAIPGRTIYLRRRIVVPESVADRPPLPVRRVRDVSGAPVRPKDDTSNEGVGHGR